MTAGSMRSSAMRPCSNIMRTITPKERVDVVGGLFEPDKYGFGLARNSPLTRQLTVEILGAHEHGLVEGLHAKYFGESP